MTTSEKVLVGLGVGVGALVLYEVFKPGSTVLRPSTTTHQTANGNVIGGLITTIEQALSTTPSPTSAGANAYGPNVWGGGATPVPAGNPAGITDPNWGTEGIDPTTGGVELAPGQAYGPVLPTTTIATGDDGLFTPDFSVDG